MHSEHLTRSRHELRCADTTPSLPLDAVTCSSAFRQKNPRTTSAVINCRPSLQGNGWARRSTTRQHRVRSRFEDGTRTSTPLTRCEKSFLRDTFPPAQPQSISCSARGRDSRARVRGCRSRVLIEQLRRLGHQCRRQLRSACRRWHWRSRWDLGERRDRRSPLERGRISE